MVGIYQEHVCTSVPEAKLVSIEGHVEGHVCSYPPAMAALFIARLVGRINSMCLALRPMSRLMTRSLCALLGTRQAWCGYLAASNISYVAVEIQHA